MIQLSGAACVQQDLLNTTICSLAKPTSQLVKLISQLLSLDESFCEKSQTVGLEKEAHAH